MTERERMLSGQLYNADDPALTEARQQAKILTYRFNNRNPLDPDYALRQQETLKNLLGRLGKNCWIEAPFRCDYGSQIAIGDWFYANYDCIFLDVADITIGDHVFFGPRVCLYTAGHPTVPEVRDLNLEYGRPIAIGDSVWIGGNTVVLPGVTIGSGSVIAAGSVVNRDIPAGVLAGGVPCRVIRPLTDEDRAYWKAHQQADHQ